MLCLPDCFLCRVYCGAGYTTYVEVGSLCVDCSRLKMYAVCTVQTKNSTFGNHHNMRQRKARDDCRHLRKHTFCEKSLCAQFSQPMVASKARVWNLNIYTYNPLGNQQKGEHPATLISAHIMCGRVTSQVFCITPHSPLTIVPIQRSHSLTLHV